MVSPLFPGRQEGLRGLWRAEGAKPSQAAWMLFGIHQTEPATESGLAV